MYADLMSRMFRPTFGRIAVGLLLSFLTLVPAGEDGDGERCQHFGAV